MKACWLYNLEKTDQCLSHGDSGYPDENLFRYLVDSSALM